jgi:hypothetical protein
MTYYINSTQARSTARNDLTIFDEVNYLMARVITVSQAGGYNVTIEDGTLMTESTPDVVVIGTNANPVIAGTPTVILGGTTITLGTTGLSLNAVIADINDAAITGLVASKDISDNLVLTYTATAAATWSFTIGAGTANGALGLSDGTFDAPDPSSTSYFNAWQGNVDDEAKRDQMNEVKKYFTNLGYTTERVTNTLTGRTFKWQITW